MITYEAKLIPGEEERVVPNSQHGRRELWDPCTLGEAEAGCLPSRTHLQADRLVLGWPQRRSDSTQPAGERFPDTILLASAQEVLGTCLSFRAHFITETYKNPMGYILRALLTFKKIKA